MPKPADGSVPLLALAAPDDALVPAPAKKAAKPRKPAVPTEPAVARLVTHFHEAHQRRHGFALDGRDWGRFGKEVKALVAAWGEETVRALIDDFFFDAEIQPQHWIVREWRPVHFLQAAQRLMLRRHGNDGRRPDAKTAASMDAVLRATGRARPAAKTPGKIPPLERT